MAYRDTVGDLEISALKTPLNIPWQGYLTRAQALPTAESIRRKKNGARYGKQRPIQRKRRG